MLFGSAFQKLYGKVQLDCQFAIIIILFRNHFLNTK